MATMTPPPELEPREESDWTPLAAFMREESLAPDDIVRLIEMGAPPLMETVNGVVWVFMPTLIDWRALAELYGFKPLREMHPEKLEPAT
jgi:hypothetical protein